MEPEPDSRASVVDLRSLEYVSSYDEHLMCPICHCPLIRPVRLQCDHVFCQKCLNMAIRSGVATPVDFSCPTCRAPTKDIFKSVPRLLINMCDEIRVKCPFAEQGCAEVVPRCHIQAHVDKYCDYRLVACPNVCCSRKTRKKDLDPQRRCLHEFHKCPECEESVMEQDLPAHVSQLCPSLKTECPDCKVTISLTDSEEHAEICTESIKVCAAAKYGCPAKLRRGDISTHEQGCPLITLGPYLEGQASRIEAMDSTLRQLRQRNEELENGIAGIRSTLDSVPNRPELESRESASNSGTATNDGNGSGNISDAAAQAMSPANEPSSSDITFPAVNRLSTESPTNTSSTATTYLLSLHESLREEVSQLSAAITDLDARASMAIMNESLRIKEDMAHTNAAVNSVRMQIHWLMNPRLHPRTTTAATGVVGLGASSAAGPSNNGNGQASGPSGQAGGGMIVNLGGLGPRRLSDSGREATKL